MTPNTLLTTWRGLSHGTSTPSTTTMCGGLAHGCGGHWKVPSVQDWQSEHHLQSTCFKLSDSRRQRTGSINWQYYRTGLAVGASPARMHECTHPTHRPQEQAEPKQLGNKCCLQCCVAPNWQTNRASLELREKITRMWGRHKDKYSQISRI